MCAESFDLFKKEDFLGMGIALGDVYLLLKKFSKSDNPSLDRAKKLKTLLQSSNRREKEVLSKRSKPATVSTHFVWYHFSEKERRYKQVRENSGGGNRVKVMKKSSNFQEIMTCAVNLFFPKGSSGSKKYISLMVYHLGDFALNKIEETNFTTLEEHMFDNGLSKIKFALMTKDFAFSDNFSDDDDFEILHSKKKKNCSNTPVPVNASTPKAEQDEKADQNKDKVNVFLCFHIK